MSKDRSKKILNEIEALREELSKRLDQIEARLAPGTGAVGVETDSTDSVVEPAESTLPDPARQHQSVAQSNEVRVIVSPLRDLSLARAVESSLAQSEGIEQATLRELRGDSATIDVVAAGGVSVVGALRRQLPVAFDVTDSDERSVTIDLAQPRAEEMGGVAAPGIP